MAENFDPSGANNMAGIKDRITKTLTEATRDMTPLETFAQVGRAAAQAATSDVTFGDALNAMNAKRLDAAKQMADFLRQEEDLRLRRDAGDRAQKGLELQGEQFKFQQDQADLENKRALKQEELDWKKFRLSERDADRADNQLEVLKQQARTAAERAAIEQKQLALKQHLAVSEAIERLVPEEQRTLFTQKLAAMGEDVDASNVVQKIGQVRAELEAAGDLPAAQEDLSAFEEKVRAVMNAYGVTRKDAVGVVAGVKGIATDQQSGLHTVYDKLEASGQLLNTPIPESGAPAAQPQAQTLFGLVESGNVTGAGPAIQETLSGPSGQVGGPVATEVIRARQIFRTEQQNLIRALSINPRFPVGEMDRIDQEINIEPSAWAGMDTLKARMLGVKQALERRLANEERAAKDIALPLTGRQAAQEAANNIRNFLSILGAPAKPAQEGGVVLSPEDEALINKHTSPQ